MYIKYVELKNYIQNSFEYLYIKLYTKVQKYIQHFNSILNICNIQGGGIIKFSEHVLYFFCDKVSFFQNSFHWVLYTYNVYILLHSKTAIVSEEGSFLEGHFIWLSCGQQLRTYTTHIIGVYGIMYNSQYFHRCGRGETVTWDYNTNIIIG